MKYQSVSYHWGYFYIHTSFLCTPCNWFYGGVCRVHVYRCLYWISPFFVPSWHALTFLGMTHLVNIIKAPKSCHQEKKKEKKSRGQESGNLDSQRDVSQKESPAVARTALLVEASQQCDRSQMGTAERQPGDYSIAQRSTANIRQPMQRLLSNWLYYLASRRERRWRREFTVDVFTLGLDS